MDRSKLITRTVKLKEEQDQALIALAAERQLEQGKRVYVSDALREVIEAGLEVIGRKGER